MSLVQLTPGNQWLACAAAVFTCLVGCHSTLLLASATLHLVNWKLTALTAMMFSVQCIFSLHFIAMTGLTLGRPWGFDIVLTLGSLAIIMAFGTAALFIVLQLRQQLEDQVCQHFPEHEERPALRHFRLLSFLLRHLPFWKVAMALVLLIVGVAGCHHIGMWSVQGVDDILLSSELTFWSLLCTGFVGSVVCCFIVASFLVLPDDHWRWATALLLTTSIATFHYVSSFFGMRYAVGTEGIHTHTLMGQESILILVVAQGALSQVVSNFFSHHAICTCRSAQQQLLMAETMAEHIAVMDLAPLREIQADTPKPSPLETALFHIVANLELYRPYLPDALFHGGFLGLSTGGIDGSATVVESPKPPRDPSPCDESVLVAAAADKHVLTPVLPQAAPPQAHMLSPSSPLRRSERASKQTNHLELGLSPCHAVVLRACLAQEDLFRGPDLNRELAEQTLVEFMGLAVLEVKENGGVVVRCTGVQITAMWRSRSPQAALKCAMAIQRRSQWPVVQVVQCGAFLAGNLAAHDLRAFHLVGPLDDIGCQLLRPARDQSMVLVTGREWEAVRLQYQCLPFEIIWGHGAPLTVYVVIALPQTIANGGDEWMYEVAATLRKSEARHVEGCWDAYVQGQYDKARERLEHVGDVPLWYAAHLQRLIEEGARLGTVVAARSMESVAWRTACCAPRETEPVLSDDWTAGPLPGAVSHAGCERPVTFEDATDAQSPGTVSHGDCASGLSPGFSPSPSLPVPRGGPAGRNRPLATLSFIKTGHGSASHWTAQALSPDAPTHSFSAS